MEYAPTIDYYTDCLDKDLDDQILKVKFYKKFNSLSNYIQSNLNAKLIEKPIPKEVEQPVKGYIYRETQIDENQFMFTFGGTHSYQVKGKYEGYIFYYIGAYYIENNKKESLGFWQIDDDTNVNEVLDYYKHALKKSTESNIIKVIVKRIFRNKDN